MKTIELYLSRVTTTIELIGGWIILPMIATLVMVDVILRYAFNTPFIWSLEFTEWHLLLVFAFALPECTRSESHISMDLVVGMLPDSITRWLPLLYYIAGIWLFYLLGTHEWEEFLFAHDLERVTEFLELPIWFHHLVLFVMSSLMIVLFVVRAAGVFVGVCPPSRGEQFND